jgi:hypothetical protein
MGGENAYDEENSDPANDQSRGLQDSGTHSVTPPGVSDVAEGTLRGLPA